MYKLKFCIITKKLKSQINGKNVYVSQCVITLSNNISK